MTENTNTTSVAKDGQTAENEQNQFKPAWVEKAEKLEKAVEQGFGVQVVYKSTAENPCEPTLLSEKQEASVYPNVVEKPVGFIAPKFDWYNSHGWIETFSEKQGKDLADMKDQIDAMQKNFTTMQKTNADQAKDNADLAKKVESMEQTATAAQQTTNQQLAQIITMLSMQSANSATKATTPASPTQATQPTEGGAN